MPQSRSRNTQNQRPRRHGSASDDLDQVSGDEMNTSSSTVAMSPIHDPREEGNRYIPSVRSSRETSVTSLSRKIPVKKSKSSNPNIDWKSVGLDLSDDSDSDESEVSKTSSRIQQQHRAPSVTSSTSSMALSGRQNQTQSRQRQLSGDSMSSKTSGMSWKSHSNDLASKRRSSSISPPPDEHHKRRKRSVSSSSSSASASSSTFVCKEEKNGDDKSMVKITTRRNENRKRSAPETSCPVEHRQRQSKSESPYLVPPLTPKVSRVPSVKGEPSPDHSPGHGHTRNKLARYDPSIISPERNEKTLSVRRQDRASSDPRLWKADENISLPDYVCTPGTIKSVTMVNIMSHTYFHKNWSPGFNFIIGENGSGKSALLSGIVAGLGGKAFDTGRASSMKDIIRNGQTKARIEIVLNNFPSKLYGENIKIVRTLSREGSSRYQIRDSNRVLRSLGRQELNLILSKLNIQVDNPLAILHQEMSRNFLRTKDPALLYGYFYRALLLSSCESLLRKSSSDLLNAVNCLKSKNALLDDLRLKEQELKKQVEVIEALRNCKQTLVQLEKEYVWAVVKEHEETFRAASKEHDDAIRRLDVAFKDRISTDMQLKDVEKNLASFEEVWKTLVTTLNVKTGECESKRADAHSIKMAMSELSGKINIATKQLVCYGNTLQNLQDRVDKYQRDSANTYERKMKELDEKKQTFNSQIQMLESEMQELSHQHTEYDSKVEAASEEEKKIESEFNETKRKILEKQDELKEFEKAKHTKYACYGQEMVKLMERIKSAQWKRTPRGPLGCCFTVKNETWAPLVEYILDNSLCSFAVDNQEDKKLMHDLIDKVYKEPGRGRSNRIFKRPSLCLFPFGDKRIDTRNGKARCDYPTILDVIDVVDDDFVTYNWLIDACRVERILLFKDYAEACDLMKSKEMVPRTAIRGYSLDAYMFFPDPNFKALVQTKLKPPKFLHITQQSFSSDSTAEHLGGEIRMLGQERLATEKKWREIKGQVKHDRKLLYQINARIQDLTRRQNLLKSELRTLESSVYSESDIAATWMEEIEAINQSILAKQQENANYEQEYAMLQAKHADSPWILVEKEIAALHLEQNNLLEQKNSAELKIGELQRELRKKESLCTTLHRAKVEANKKCQEAEKALRAQKVIALKHCERITELSRTPHEIKVKYDTLKAELAKNKSKVSQRSSVIQSYLKAKDIADKVKEEIDIMTLLINLAQPKIKLQQDHFRRKMLEYGISVRTCFRNLIKSRCYWGDLVISHDDKTLICYVSLDTTSDNRAKRNLEVVNGQPVITSKKGIMEYSGGMSGGERSFTTICFLVACWQLMDMPFYILDEFDVFMDAFNRRISQEILMNVAKSKPYAQFFVFTPLPLDIRPPEGSRMLELFKGKNKNQKSFEKSRADQEENERD